jgi:hypothetical protein
VAENKSGSADSVVRRTQRRMKFQTVAAGLRVVFAFLLLSALGGFSYGMWEEVKVTPERYAAREFEGGAAYLEHWSVKTGRLIAAAQGVEADSYLSRNDLARAEEPGSPIRPEPARLDPTAPPADPTEPKPDPKPVDPLDLLKKYPDPPPERRPEPPSHPPVRPERPTPPNRHPGMDAKTAELLKKAREARRIGLKHYEKAGPDAPSRKIRIEATILTLKYLKPAQLYYEAALKRKMGKRDRDSAVAELSSIQRRIFWCHKFLPARRRR